MVLPTDTLRYYEVIFTAFQTRLACNICPFCENSSSSRQYIFPINEDKVYDVPKMIIHYIEEHKYLPPQELIDYILNL